VRGARYAVLAVGVVGLSTAGVWYKLATAPIVAVVAYRMLFAVVLTLPMSYWLEVRRAAPRATSRSDVAAAAGAGALFAADVTLWALSLGWTTVSSAALLVSMDPIFVAAFAWIFLKERPSPAMFAGMAVAVGGAAVITWGDLRFSGRALIGDALALTAAFAETGYLLVGRYVRRRVATLRYVSIVYVACAACVWVILGLSGSGARMGLHDLGIALALAVCANVLGHTLVSESLGHMPAAVVAVSFLSQPILTAGLAYIVLHQAVPVWTAVGGSIALAGIAVVAFANELTVPGSSRVTL
jgi:drug/metabolite transporter (DMT)-like permease